MALQKQNVMLNFAKGLDLKTDPWQVPFGNFLALQNAIKQTGGLLEKRNGFGALPSLPDTSTTNMTTFNGNLIALGNRLQALSPDTGVWYDKGVIQPLNLSVQAVVRTSTSQGTVDMAIAPNGLGCVAYFDSSLNSYYEVVDSATSQVIVNITQLPATAVMPRVFVLGRYFVITYLVGVTGTHLQYVAVPINLPTSPTAPTDISTLVSSETAGYDGYVANNNLYLAWNGSDGGGAIRLSYLDSTLSQHNTVVVTGHTADLMSVSADDTQTTPVIWFTFWDAADDNGYTMAYSQILVQVLPPTQVITGIIINELTSTVNAGINTIFYETVNDYSYEPVRTDFVSSITVTQLGVVGTPLVVLRGVGLASKSFFFAPNGLIYLLVVYGGAFQPTYFLIDQLGNVIAHVAYSNASGLALNQILPSVFVNGNVISIGYLYKDQLVPVNKAQGVPNVAGIYAQTGINLVTFDVNNNSLVTAEIANNLHITGGFLWMYDRVKPVEHGFFVWPEDILATPVDSGGGMDPETYFYQFTYEWTDGAGNLHRSAPSVPVEVNLLTAFPGVIVTSIFTSGEFTIPVSSIVGITPGQAVSDITTPSNLLDGTVVLSMTATTVTLNQPTQGASGLTPGDDLSFAGGTPLATTSVFPAGALTITVASPTGFHVGQTITDATTPSNLTPGTIILAISGSVFTLNYPTAGASAASPGDTISTDDTYSVVINVPTLRQTYKVGINPVRIVGYRWSQDQQIYYQFTSIQFPILNNTTIDSVVITDTLNDAEILGNVILYTTGGVVEDIAAPACTVMTLYKTRLVLVDAEDQNLLWFSKQVIENVPVELSDLFTLYIAPTIGAQGSTGVITALASMDDKLIIFKKDAAYYITGDGPDNTGANSDFSDTIFITSTVGTVDQNSLVMTPNGLLFSSDKGIWILGRDLSTNYIGAPVELYNTALVESALTCPGTNQARFTLNNGLTLMYDYFFSQWGTFNNIPALSSTLYQGLHTYVNQFGQVFQETPGVYIDGSNPVLMSFTTSWINLAGVQGYERAYFFFLLGQYITPHVLNVEIGYDYNPYPTQTSRISPINFNPPYGSDPLYGDQTPYGGNYSVEEWRVFFQVQKCKAFQLTISEVYDSSYGVPAGAGLTITGLNIVVGVKSGYQRIPSRQYIG